MRASDRMMTPSAVAGPTTPAAAGKALMLGTLAFVVCFYAWALFGPLAPALQQQLHLSEAQTSWLVAIPVLLGSLLRVPLGALTDRFGARRVFPALMGTSVLPLLALGTWHTSFASVLGAGFVLGFAGASFAVGVPYVSRWYPPARQGLALGVYGMGMGGTVATALTAPTVARLWGLGAPFYLGTALVAAAGLLFALLAEEPPSPRPKSASLWAAFAVFRQDARAWALTLFYFLAFGGFVALFLYLPKLLVGVYHLSPTDAGARAAGFALLAVLARPTGGILADRLGAARVLAVAFAATAILALALAGWYDAIVPLTIACLLLAVALGLGTGAVFKLVAQVFPSQVGAVTGVVGAAGGLGGFFPPLVMAAVYGATGRYTLGFALLALTAAGCLLLLRSLPMDPRAA